jgi:hypothetical protein
MTTALHSDKNVFHPSRLSAAQASALVAREEPTAQVLAAVVLSVLGIRSR